MYLIILFYCILLYCSSVFYYTVISVFDNIVLVYLITLFYCILLYCSSVCYNIYSEPYKDSIFPKYVAIKMNCFTESIMSRLICKKGCLFLFPRVLDSY